MQRMHVFPADCGYWFQSHFQVDMYNRPKIPSAYHHQLPKFDRPTSAPALTYVVVGPSVRGKFDVEKSLALGVPKHQRSKLTNGETITVTVKEGDETIQRVVQPQDCIGPSETPAVGAAAFSTFTPHQRSTGCNNSGRSDSLAHSISCLFF
jgi:hypothetical protein